MDLAVYQRSFAPEIRRSRFAHGWLENEILVPVRTRRALWAKLHASGKEPEMFGGLAGELAELRGFCEEMETAYSPVPLVAALLPGLPEPVLERVRGVLGERYGKSDLMDRVIPDLRDAVRELSLAASECVAAWRRSMFENMSVVFDALEHAAQRALDILQRDVPRGIVLP